MLFNSAMLLLISCFLCSFGVVLLAMWALQKRGSRNQRNQDPEAARRARSLAIMRDPALQAQSASDR
jgi:hypothetical protein